MAFFALLLVASISGEKVGVPVWLDVDPYTVHYGRGAEVERDSITTAYGWGMIVLSVLAAVATWHVVRGKQTTPDGRAHFSDAMPTPASALPAGRYHLSTRRGKQFNSMVWRDRDPLTGALAQPFDEPAARRAMLGELGFIQIEADEDVALRRVG